MNPPTLDVTTIPRIGHDEAMRIAVVENRKFADQIRSVVGSAAGQASPREFIRQVRRGKPLVAEIGARYWWDGMNEVQVRERASHSPNQLIEEWDAVSARAVRARTKIPRLITSLPLLNLPEPVGRQKLRYLFDIGFTRDLWAHRIDLARATGRTFDADSDHDGRILADCVAEWATTHGKPFTLDLGGPAGGQFQQGTGGEAVQLDAIEFVRILAGRERGGGVLRHPLPL